MKLITRKIEEKDWDTLCDWWNGHKFPIPSKDALPEGGMGGLMVEQDGLPVIAGFLFQTNTKGCWFEFIISNPDYKENREKITKELVNRAEIAAKITSTADKDVTVLLANAKKQSEKYANQTFENKKSMENLSVTIPKGPLAQEVS